MLKKFNILALIVLLIVQTMIAPITATALGQAQTGTSETTVLSSGVFLDEQGADVTKTGVGSTRIIQFQWIYNEDVEIDENYSRELPKNFIVTKEQSGYLTHEGGLIGIFSVTEDGLVSIRFDEGIDGLYERATGTFTVEVEVIVEEEQPENGTNAKEAHEDSSNSIKGQNATITNAVAAKVIEENIIDELRLIREDGTLYEVGDLLEIGEDLGLEIDWSLPNNPIYVSGDTFIFQLPEQLKIYNELLGELDEYGSYVVSVDGSVTFTFNDMIDNNSNVKGTFWVETELDQQKVHTTTEELQFVMNNGEVEKITINIKPLNGQAIQKNGQPVGGNFNAEEIEWTVVVNTTRDSLENAIINDPILAGQELVLDSVELKKVEVNLQGHVVEVLDDEVSYTDESTKEELKLGLGDTNKAYQLTFRSKMKDEEKDKEGSTSYPNTAYLNSNGKQQAQSGASVSVNRPKSLEKTSSTFNKNDRSVEWEVKANFTEKGLSAGTEIIDEFTFTIGEETVDNVFEVTEANIDIQQVDEFNNNGSVKTKSDAKELFDISIVGNKVAYKLKDASNKAFVIKYKTKAKEGAYITDDGTISNTVNINGEIVTSSQRVFQQVGVKTNSGINYENRTIDWTITVNADGQALMDFVLTDRFAGSGQELVPGTIKIEPNATGVIITPDADNEGFKINFGNINESYTITYQTAFIYNFGHTNEKPIFENWVNLSYETSGGQKYELEISNNVNPNDKTKNNGAKNNSVDNETKEITWMVDINYNQLVLEEGEAKLMDSIAANQSLVEGSVKVYPTTINQHGEISVGENEVEDFEVVATENNINIDFGPIDQSYRVVFVTVDKDGIYNSEEVYENTAQFIPSGGQIHNLYSNATLPNQGQFLGKTGFHNKEDWTIDWQITVNKSHSVLNGVTVKDDLGESQVLLEETIEVTKEGSNNPLIEGVDYELQVDGNEFSVTFIGEIKETYYVTYSSYILAEASVQISNEAGIESVEETIIGSVNTVESVEVKISTGGGTGEGVTGELILEKVEKDTNRPLEDVAFTLTKKIGNQTIFVREGSTDATGKIHWTGLKFDNYILEEVLPEGYLGEESQVINVSSDAPDGIQMKRIENERQTGTAVIEKVDATTGEKLDGAVFEITNLVTSQKYTLTTDEGTVSEEVPFGEYTVVEMTAPTGYRITEGIDNITIEIDETTVIEVANEAIVEVAGQKTWIGDLDLVVPNAITVELFANGEKKDEIQVSADTDWKYSFTNLDKYDENGEIEYSIEEVEVDGYVSQKDGFNLTNIQTVNISGEKIWIEVDEQYRPDSITVNLLANGEEIKTQVVTANEENEWKFFFSDLAKYDTDGNEIVFTIEEVDVKGYTAEIENFTITNTQETTEFTGTKHWKDNDNAIGARPELIIVQLLHGERIVTEQEVAADENDEWNYTFSGLPKYDKDGNEILYSVVEKEIDGYESTVEGNDITNLIVGTTEVSGEKTWVEVDDQYRPDSIIVNLLANGNAVDSQEVTMNEEGKWTFTFTDLAKYDTDGVEIDYTIMEDEVPGYVSEVDGYTIRNTQESTEVSGEKTWVEVDDQFRPDSIIVNLLANGGEVDSQEVTVNEEGEWTFTFVDLAKYDTDGIEINYTVMEDEVPGYLSEVDGYTITNTQETTEIEGTKTWKDGGAKDRPESIFVQVMNADEVVQEQEVTAESDWSFTFPDLAKYDAEGNEIQYSINELPVPGYATGVEGFNITNTKTSQIDVAGTKIWKGDSEEDRPTSITVQLLANGEVVDSVRVTAATGWTYIFENVNAYDVEGVAIDYMVEEVEVDGYETSINGYDITNTFIPVIPETENSSKPVEGGTLPKTATDIFNIMLIGFGLIVIGSASIFIGRKKLVVRN